MNIKDVYSWEIELKDGVKVTNHNNFKQDEVVKVSFIPTNLVFPRHDIVFVGREYKFVSRFGRAFMGWDSIIKEYLHCVVTNRFRLWVKSSSGSSVITDRDYEWYI